MTDQMTPKERWLAAIRMQPVDRLPFWPKLGGGYSQAQAEPFRDMDTDAIQDWIGNDKHIRIADCIRVQRTHTAIEEHRDGSVLETVFRTPHGELKRVHHFDEPSQSWHPVHFPVTDLESIQRMTDIYEDVTVDLNAAALEAARSQSERIGPCALTTTTIGESPLMHWVEWLAGVENAHFLLMDHPAEVEALFDAMQRVLVQKTELLCEHNPADVFYMVENTSTTLISPDQYQRYCAHHVGEIAALTTAAGRNLLLHMCGHLKALLPALAAIPVQGFEAFTSPPLGNTSLLDGRTACPDKCLIGGTNAMLWTRPAGEIVAQIEKDLDALPHHRGIVVTSAGVMPPLCKPATIRQVFDWVKQYPVG